ncbi:DUF3871 family protein [Bacteroides sp. AM10-21B]|uniref:DUF3871 family protein n=1 Tax=Bacteroides sp. AM10-21B TaxID=2292001 RepID=UPI000E4E9EA9|nr:DUF3871 family protein [Bacteroides sp. AM10-21B]RHJ53150.1 DUF3871 family protein [Bacteroides sp. AM10-21B]
MENLVLLPTMAQKRSSDFKQYAEDATVILEETTKVQKVNHFIEANTMEIDLQHLKSDCIVPVFSKDNELTISHNAFIETVCEATLSFFRGETVDKPDIRVSHIVKGRIPEAIHKPANQLLESDKTQYFERMMFCIEVPTIYETIEGNKLTLTIGGVRAYNHMNLYSKKTVEKFKVFIGFKNLVCTNLCVSTDGYKSCLEVSNTSELYRAVLEMFHAYNPAKHIHLMQTLGNSFLTEHQFAQILGKMRLYQCLPQGYQKSIPRLLITDTQINSVAKAYIQDENFGSFGSDINMWKFYNLLTGANKSSYIDSFLDRAYNATEIAQGINMALHGDERYKWFID